MIQASKLGLRIMRYQLTDYDWAAIRPMLPNKPRGVARGDDRRVLNGIISDGWASDRSVVVGRLPSTIASMVLSSLQSLNRVRYDVGARPASTRRARRLPLTS